MKKKIISFLLKRLMSEDERFVLILAIDDRIDRLHELKITDSDIDYTNCIVDINTLKDQRDYFTTELYY